MSSSQEPPPEQSGKPTEALKRLAQRAGDMREEELRAPKPKESKKRTSDPPRSATAAFSRAAVRQKAGTESTDDRRAGFLLRSLALAVDTALLLIIFAATAAGTAWAYGLADLKGLGGGDLVLGVFTLTTQTPLVASALFLFAFAVATLYFVFFHATLSRTPGKVAVGLRVVTDAGLPLRLPQAIARWAAFVLCVLTCGLGFLWTAFSEVQEGLHDKLTRTHVQRV